MNSAHIHLMLVHLPVVLIPLAALLLGWGIWRSSSSVRKTAVAIAVLGSVCSIPAFLAGEGAEDLVEDRPGVSERVIEQHEEVAEVAFWLSLVLLAAALTSVALEARSHSLTARAYSTSLALAIVCSVTLAYAANLGGRIRHPEAFAVGTVQHTDRDDD
ncbi:MAG: hypothetical protein K1X79_10040 [Oligoflexia bacterium]|nr:hypothetical protein [Oligoflexia bacterium]